MSSMIFSSCYHALISGCNWDFSHIVSCSLAFGCHVAHIPLWPAKWPNNKSGFLSSGYPYQEIHETNFSWRMALSCSGVVRVNWDFFFLKKKILFTCTTARVCPISMRSSDLRMCMILAAMTRALLS